MKEIIYNENNLKDCDINKVVKRAKAIIINSNDEILFGYGDRNYQLPGGHLEDNETEIETAIREVKEETNLDIVIDENKRFVISYIVKGVINKDAVYYIAEPKDNVELKAQEEEVEEAIWVDINDAENYLEFDNIKDLWNQVLDKLKESV